MDAQCFVWKVSCLYFSWILFTRMWKASLPAFLLTLNRSSDETNFSERLTTVRLTLFSLFLLRSRSSASSAVYFFFRRGVGETLKMTLPDELPVYGDSWCCCHFCCLRVNGYIWSTQRSAEKLPIRRRLCLVGCLQFILVMTLCTMLQHKMIEYMLGRGGSIIK